MSFYLYSSVLRSKSFNYVHHKSRHSPFVCSYTSVSLSPPCRVLFSLPLFPRGPVDARAPARVPPGPRYLLWQTVGYVRRNVGSDFAPLCGKKEKKWRVTRRRLRLSRLTAATPAFRPGYAALCLASGLYTLLLLAKLLAFSRYDILVCSTFEGYFVYGKWLSRPSCIIGSISVKFYKLMVTSCWQ